MQDSLPVIKPTVSKNIGKLKAVTLPYPNVLLMEGSPIASTGVHT